MDILIVEHFDICSSMIANDDDNSIENFCNHRHVRDTTHQTIDKLCKRTTEP